MAARIKVGSYIIDFAESGSTSTTSGVVGHFPDGGLVLIETPESVSFDFIITLSGMANAAAVKAALDALDTVLHGLSGDVVIESAPSATFREFKTSDGTFTRLAIRTETYAGDNHGVVTVGCTLTRETATPPSGGLPTGALDVFNWQHDQDVDGLGAVIGTFEFKTRADAIAYAQLLRTGTRPAWLSAAYKLSRLAYESTEPVTGEFRPSRLVATWVMLPAWAVASGAFNDVRVFTAQTQVQPRRLDLRAATEPGYDVLLSGSLEFKVEDDTTADPLDSGAVTAAQLRALADAAIDAIIAETSVRLDEGVIIELSRDYSRVDVRSGTVHFEVTGITGLRNRILTWQETVTFRIVDRSTKVFHSAPAANGKRFTRFEHAGGYEQTVHQQITVTSLGAARVPLPNPVGISGRDWRELNAAPTVPVAIGTQDGLTVWETSNTREWEWDGDGPMRGLPSDRETVARL